MIDLQPINELEAPWKSYQRLPNRILDMRDFEVNTNQSKSYNFKQRQTPIVRESETWLILFQNSTIYKNMVGGDDTRTPASPTTYNTANGNEFDFSRYFGNDGNWNYLWLWNATTAYVVGDVISIAKAYYYCIQNNTNQSPPNATYWIAVGSWQLSNIGNLSMWSNIVEVIDSCLVEIEFWFAMSLNSNIWGVVAAISSSVNGIILSWEMAWGTVTPDLSDSVEIISWHKSKKYYATAGEQLEYVFTVSPEWWAWNFTLLGADDETYRGIYALRPNW